MGRETEILRSRSSSREDHKVGGEERTERSTEPKANKQLKAPTLVFLLQLKLIVITIIVIVIQHGD